MDSIHKLSLFGGLFSILTFIHFFVDWIFQSHKEAMIKHNNAFVRAKHCIIYSVGFLPYMWYLHFDLFKILICFNVLFWSHFYLDTYHIVYLWARFIRRPPEMENVSNPHEGFIQFVQTPLGKILMITIDQISHLSFLWTLIYFSF